MATKVINLDDVGPVMLVKRAGNRSLRLSVTQGGVRVSMPTWTPYVAGESFARKNTAWIVAELAKQTRTSLFSGQRISKVHTLKFEPSAKPTSRVTSTSVVIGLPNGEAADSPEAQKRAYEACIRALKREASTLLPPRLKLLSERYDKPFATVVIKQLKRRWGSCDSHQNIALNLFLMELPWDYIDYVLLHELTHTVHMHHGEDFWQELVNMQPRARDLAKVLRKHQPVIGSWHD